MKVGVLTAPFYDRPLEDVLDRLAAAGVEAIEFGTGNYPGSDHCDPDLLLADRSERQRLLRLVESRGMFISALSQHGNPLHPQRMVAQQAHETWRKTVRLAEALEVPVVNAFSGCPGDCPESQWPNWVTCAWPPDYLTILDWQWRECVIPYWRTEEAFARARGIRVAIEMHPGFVVYNPETLLRLRRSTGSHLGCNFDPSHLFWQGIDPNAAIDELAREEAIFHFHAKDTCLNRELVARKGVLDTEPLEHVAERSWSFCTLGLGHSEQEWRSILNALHRAGYDYVASIEHEDLMLETDEAVEQAIGFLKRVLPQREVGSAVGAALTHAPKMTQAGAEAPHQKEESDD